ncbi:MAG: diguanylate cyclase [Aestuariibacter sp.]
MNTHHRQPSHVTGLWLCAFLLLSCGSMAATLTHTKSNDPKETLVLQILKLAISKSGQENKYQYEAYDSFITEARLFEMVKDNKISVMWAGTQEKYESELLPIRIPVLKGLLGHRIFIIRNGEQEKFNAVRSLEKLQQIPLGQGRFWGDTAVLKHNQMSVVAPVKYASLFYMLEGGRFDFFPRAVHEPWSEVEARPELNLTVENNILLIYPFAMYFFVNRDSTELAKNIETGFLAAIEDGSFDDLFFNHPMIQDALNQANLKQRKVFRLSNPNMSPMTPVDDKRLWLDIATL